MRRSRGPTGFEPVQVRPGRSLGVPENPVTARLSCNSVLGRQAESTGDATASSFGSSSSLTSYSSGRSGSEGIADCPAGYWIGAS
jgi:hypothetical protein